jgi:hypothetical protein
LLELESILVNYVRHRGLAMWYFKIIIELDYCSITIESEGLLTIVATNVKVKEQMHGM